MLRRIPSPTEMSGENTRFQLWVRWEPMIIARVSLATAKLVGMPRDLQSAIQYTKFESPMLPPIRSGFQVKRLQVKSRWCGLWSGRDLDPR
jgi:hypothetical protein